MQKIFQQQYVEIIFCFILSSTKEIYRIFVAKHLCIGTYFEIDIKNCL